MSLDKSKGIGIIKADSVITIKSSESYCLKINAWEAWEAWIVSPTQKQFLLSSSYLTTLIPWEVSAGLWRSAMLWTMTFNRWACCSSKWAIALRLGEQKKAWNESHNQHTMAQKMTHQVPRKISKNEWVELSGNHGPSGQFIGLSTLSLQWDATGSVWRTGREGTTPSGGTAYLLRWKGLTALNPLSVCSGWFIGRPTAGIR